MKEGTKWNDGARVLFAAKLIFVLAVHLVIICSTLTPPNPHTNGSYTTIACEGSMLSIKCKENEVFHIITANYGRRDYKTCNDKFPNQTAHWDLNCGSTNSLSKVQELCNSSGESNCTVRATNDVFGDPCEGTGKYLELKYMCYEGNTTIPPYYEVSTPGVATCNESQRCQSDKKRKVEWNEACPNAQSLSPCPNNKQLRLAKRMCGEKSNWTGVPDLSECVSEELLNLSRKLDALKTDFSPTGVLELMGGLDKVATKGEDLYGGDLLKLAEVMLDTVNLTSVNRQTNISYAVADTVNELVMNTTSNFLQSEANETWMDLPPIKQSSTATRLLTSVELSSAVLVNSINGSKTVNRSAPGLDIQVAVVNRFQLEYSQPAYTWSYSSLDNGVQLSQVILGNNLSETATDKVLTGFGRVAVALFDGIAQWLHVNSSALNNCPSDAENKSRPALVVNTGVLSISIVSESEKDNNNTKDRVIFTLEHDKTNYSNPICVFWNYSKETFEGHWSDDGCKVDSNSSNATHTVCDCNHLTNFAVLMSFSGYEIPKEHQFYLSVITYIGCMISIVCLALAFITFYWFRGLQCDRNTIHKNLVLCLLISEVIFLLGIVQEKHRALCNIVTGFLHYFFLAAFSWMCLEGVQLYVLLIEVFEAEKSRLGWYYISGYGVPAVIVLISILTTAFRPGNYYYASTQFCWLSTDGGLIWAFVGPVALIICVNSVMLGVAIHTMCKHTSTASSWKLKQKSKIDTIGSWVRGAVVLMILLGSTWIFGFLALNQETLFMYYIFTIANSLQGLFIFIFHCVTNEKVRKEYRRCIQRRTWLPENVRIKYGGLSGSAALSTTPNQSNSSGVPMFFRMLKNRRRNNSLSSSSFQKSSSESNKKGNMLVVISPPGEGSSSSATSRKVKRHKSSTSESARLTDSSGIPSSDYLYDHDDETTEDPSGYLDAVITHVDENEFNGPDLAEISALEESVIIADCRAEDYRR